MSSLKIHIDPRVIVKINNIPPKPKLKLNYLRKLIIKVASEDDLIEEIEETLKWGEPSYLTKKGSTLRINWNPKTPEQYAIYFKCTSKLVPTFKEVYNDLFNYENNRAIVFKLDDVIPEKELIECIRVTLNYHTLKKIPKLGL